MSESVREQPHALIEQREHVLIVTMNRPQARNALSPAMMALMRQAWDQVDADPDIRVCVLTGAGGAFCAGADLKAMTSDHPGSRLGDFDLAVAADQRHPPGEGIDGMLEQVGHVQRHGIEIRTCYCF